jgi:hypothetical protein
MGREGRERGREMCSPKNLDYCLRRGILCAVLQRFNFFACVQTVWCAGYSRESESNNVRVFFLF